MGYFYFIFIFIFCTLLLSSFWTSRGHRCRPFSPPGSCLRFFIAHRVQQSHCSSNFHRVLLGYTGPQVDSLPPFPFHLPPGVLQGYEDLRSDRLRPCRSRTETNLGRFQLFLATLFHFFNVFVLPVIGLLPFSRCSFLFEHCLTLPGADPAIYGA